MENLVKNQDSTYGMYLVNTLFTNVWFQKLSVPPPWKGFSLRPPHLSGNSSQASYIYLTLWAFEKPAPPPPEFPIPSVGGVWIFSGTTQCSLNPISPISTNKLSRLMSIHFLVLVERI